MLTAGAALGGRQGLVQSVGVSNYGPKQLSKIHAYLSKRDVPLASVQVRWRRLAVNTSCLSLARAYTLMKGPHGRAAGLRVNPK